MTTAINNMMNIILEQYEVLLEIHHEILSDELSLDLNKLIFDIKMLMMDFSINNDNNKEINRIYDIMWDILNHIKHWPKKSNVIIGSIPGCKWVKGRGFNIS